MYTQKNKLVSIFKTGFGLLILMILSFPTAMAQFSNGNLIQDGNKHTVAFKSNVYQDAKIPTNTNYEYIYLSAVGGDGGYKKATSSWNGKTWGGGKGATVSAVFKIGTGQGEIPAGSTIRYIVGEKGQSAATGVSSGAGGGGGTGVAFKAPNGSWKLLLVAGGGGGGEGDCCTSGTTGKPGKAYVRGNEGSGKSEKSLKGAGTGGSILSGSDDKDGGHHTEAAWPGYPDKGEPQGGQCLDNSKKGGFGFSAGGNGDASSGTGAGGGGGYTGGRYGRILVKEAAEGGTSYINETEMLVIAIHSQENGSTKDPQNGYAHFQFVGAPFYLALKSDENKVMARNAEPENFANNADMSLTDRALINPSTANQLWYYDESTSMIHLAANPGKCMHLPYTNTTNGTKIRAHDCNTSWGSQKWTIDGDLIRLKGNQDKCLMKKWENHDNGNLAVIGDCGNASHDRREWKIVPYTPPTFITLNADIEKALQKDGSSNYLEVGNRGSGSSNNTEYKLWYYDENTSMIRLASQPEKCVNLPYADAENGKKIALQDCNPNWGSQRWTLSGKEIHLKSNPGKCLVKRWDANSIDNPIVIWDCGSASHTRKDWVFTTN